MNPNRVVKPIGKVAYYRSDGTGRDTYIRQHNGGLLSQDRIHKLKQPKLVQQRKLTFSNNVYGRHPYSYRNGASNKFPHYISDGSGRDYYVKNTQGGNSNPFQWRDETLYKFKSSLRSSERLPNHNPEKPDIFAQTQMRMTNQSSKFSKTMSVYQKGLNDRLSEPKMVWKPPSLQKYYQKDFDATRIQKICQRQLPYTTQTFYKGSA